jgi:signal peptide peptidase-like 2B
MYAFGCSSAVVQVIFHPLCRKLARKYHHREIIVWQTGTADFGDITNIDIVSCILGYSLGMSWLYVAFFATHPEELTFFWVGQDIMGACMCIVFLGLIKLNSIRVASVLLVVAFLYDIFFVFVTPYLFHGKSVMITVATSGGPPKADADWCEKYPSDGDCQGGDPLPMLLTMPRIGDYAGGASLLGLGDIVREYCSSVQTSGDYLRWTVIPCSPIFTLSVATRLLLLLV